MTAEPRRVLYSPELLALAVELADVPFDPEAPLHGEARSRTCGSTVALSCSRDETRGLATLGMRLTACAVGQAAGAIFAGGAPGRTIDELEQASEAIALWLTRAGQRPDWPRIEALQQARGYPARHEAILLPWKAALDALSKHQSAR